MTLWRKAQAVGEKKAMAARGARDGETLLGVREGPRGDWEPSTAMQARAMCGSVRGAALR